MEDQKLVLIFNYENPVFTSYCCWAAILVGKMICMSFLTSFHRLRTKSFQNKEDLPQKDLEVNFNQPDVERVRRAHLNDLENILPYLAVALLYVCTNPPELEAKMLFRVTAIARIIHSFVYAVYVVRQPARAIAYLVCVAIIVYMAIRVFIFSMAHI